MRERGLREMDERERFKRWINERGLREMDERERFKRDG